MYQMCNPEREEEATNGGHANEADRMCVEKEESVTQENAARCGW